MKQSTVIALPWIVLAGHTVAVFALGALVYANLPERSDITDDVRMAWNLFLMVDFPSSILAGVIFFVVESGWEGDSFDVRLAVILPAVLFTVFGGVQYFWLTRWLVRRIAARQEE